MLSAKEAQPTYKPVWSVPRKLDNTTVMLFQPTTTCTTALLMKCARTKRRLIQWKQSMQTCDIIWNDWHVSHVVFPVVWMLYSGTCGSLLIVTINVSWWNRNILITLCRSLTSCILYDGHSPCPLRRSDKIWAGFVAVRERSPANEESLMIELGMLRRHERSSAWHNSKGYYEKYSIYRRTDLGCDRPFISYCHGDGLVVACDRLVCTKT